MSKINQPVEVASMQPQQIAQVRNNLEQEIDILNESIRSMQFVAMKFSEARMVLSKIHDTDKGKEIFVPLTSSLYVPGKMQNIDNFKIDIGTGFFVEKTRQEAIDYYIRKTEQIVQNIDSLKQIRSNKAKDLQQMEIVLQSKLQPASA